MQLSTLDLLNDDNLQAYWRFESGSDTTDSSDNSNTLTHINTPTNEGGKYGNCMHYDPGSTEYSYAADSADLSLTGQFTVSCWVWIDSLPASNDSYMAIVAKYYYVAGDTSGYQIDLNKDASGNQRVRTYFAYNPGIHLPEVSVIKTLSTGAWHHIVSRHNGTLLELWVDGSSIGNTSSSGLNPSDNSQNLTIGRQTDFESRFFDGKVDDLAVFDRALTDTEIENLYSDSSVSLSPSLSSSFSPSASQSPSSSESLSLSLSPSISESVSISLSPSASLSPSLSESLSLSFSPSASQSPSSSESFSLSLSPSVSESISESLSPSISPSISESLSPSLSPSVSESLSISLSPSASLSPSSSESLSLSLSPSISESLSISLSQSISESLSLSLSPSISESVSISLSPSVSESLSLSLSPSASQSPSSSKSLSLSLSPSISVSLSISPSPSTGFTDYNRGDYADLPANDDDLETNYSVQDVTDVATKNDVRVNQTATQEHMIHQYKNFVGNESSCQLEWEGQTTLAPTSSTVYLQAYNHDTTAWVTVDSDNSSNDDTDFILITEIADLTDYKNNSNVISCRVYQEAT